MRSSFLPRGFAKMRMNITFETAYVIVNFSEVMIVAMYLDRLNALSVHKTE